MDSQAYITKIFQMLVTHVRWGNLARECMSHEFSRTTDHYNLIYLTIWRFPAYCCNVSSHLYERTEIPMLTRQSEMADLARRATRDLSQFHMGGSELRHRSILETITHRPKCQIQVVGIIFPYILKPIPNLYDHSFPRYGQITFLTFRRPTTLTFDLKFWKYLSVTVYPYVICMPSFIMIGWEMAEILHFEILRKHGQTNTQTNTHTNKQTHTQTDMGITIPRPPPMGGEVTMGGEVNIILIR